MILSYILFFDSVAQWKWYAAVEKKFSTDEQCVFLTSDTQHAHVQKMERTMQMKKCACVRSLWGFWKIQFMQKDKECTTTEDRTKDEDALQATFYAKNLFYAFTL